MITYIYFLRNSMGTLSWATDSLSCYSSLEFVIFKLVRLVASDVAALAGFFRA